MDLRNDCEMSYARGHIDLQEGMYLPVSVERVRGTVKRDAHGGIIDVIPVPPLEPGPPF
jgi:hypothetical protein